MPIIKTIYNYIKNIYKKQDRDQDNELESTSYADNIIIVDPKQFSDEITL